MLSKLRNIGLTSRMLVLASALVIGCAAMKGTPDFELRLPKFKAQPVMLKCQMQHPETASLDGKLYDPEDADCVLMLASDLEAILIELEAACVAATGDARKCKVF